MQVNFTAFYGAVLNVANQRANLVANNIANADTPGFKAQDLDFDTSLATQLDGTQVASGVAGPQYRIDGSVALDGNDVSLDQERVEALRNGQQMTAASTFLHQSTADLIIALRPNPGGI